VIGLVVCVILFLIVLGSLVPTIGKVFASNAVKRAGLAIHSLDFLELASDLAVIRIKGEINNEASLGGIFEEFPMDVYILSSEYDRGELVGTLLMPSLTVKASTSNPFDETVTLNIINIENFMVSASTLVNNAIFYLRFSGETTLRSNGLSFNKILFDKTISLAGMNGLANVTVLSFDLSPSTNEEVMFQMDLSFFNPSSLSIDIGSINLDIFHDGARFGRGTVLSLLITPGLFQVAFYGSVSFNDLEGDDLEKVVEMFNYYLTGNPIVVTTRVSEKSGLSSALLESALNSWNLLAFIPGSTSSLFHSISFLELDIAPVAGDQILFGASLAVVLNSPLGDDVVLDVKQVKVDISLRNENGGTLFTSSIPFTPTNNIPGTVKPTAQLYVSSLISFSPEEEMNYIDFVRSFVNHEEVVVIVSGSMDGEVIVGPLGRLLLRGIDTKVESFLLGMNALSDNRVLEFDLSKSTQETVFVDLNIELVNPSIATVTLGDLSLDLVYEDQVVGFLSTSNVTFFPSTNRLNLRGALDPDENNPNATNAARSLFTTYVSGGLVSLTARARGDSLDHRILNQGFQGFSITAPLPRIANPLVEAISFSSMRLEPNSSDYSLVFLQTKVEMLLDSPLGPNSLFETLSVALSSSIFFSQNGTRQLLGVFSNLGRSSTVISSNAARVEISLKGDFAIEGDGSNLVDLISLFIDAAPASIDVDGVATVEVRTHFGIVSLEDVPVYQSFSFLGNDRLPPLEITSLDLPANVEDSIFEGIIISLNATLENPLMVTFALGNVVLDVYFQGTRQAFLEQTDLVLVPGTNVIAATGRINPDVDDLDKTGEFFSALVAGVSYPFTMRIAAKDPQSAAPWFSQILADFELRSSFPAGAPLDLVRNISLFNQLDSVLLEPGFPTFSGTIMITFQNPFSFQITIQQIRVSMSIKDNENQVLAAKFVDWSPLASHGDFFTMNITFNANLEDQKENAMGFIQNLLQTDGTDMHVDLTTSAQVQTGAGVVVISNLSASYPIPVNGFRSFDGLISFQDFNLHQGAGNVIEFCAVLNIFSQSTIDIVLGGMHFEIVSRNVTLGNATSNQFSLEGSSSGKINQIDLNGTFEHSSQPIIDEISCLLSNFMNQIETQLTLKRLVLLDPSPIQGALEAIQITTSLPGLEYQVLAGIQVLGLIHDEFSLLPLNLSFAATLQIINPLNLPFTILEASFDSKVRIFLRKIGTSLTKQTPKVELNSSWLL